jgi:N,N'-diacetyllegionaminate synthase
MNPITIIAEVGSVHDGSFGNAKSLIEMAAECGADVIKFQTHLASAETLRDAPEPPYFKGEPRFEYFERTGFSLEEWKELALVSAGHNIEFVSSPFSNDAVELLEEIGVGRYKIPSGEVTNIPLLEAVAETGKPVLLSSGMSDWSEMDRAVETITRWHDDLCVMQCSSVYPCPPERVGLNVLSEMRDRWKIEVGYSDHTLNNSACLAAVALGATTLEKHLTFSRRMYGSDARYSSEPQQFSDLVNGVREISKMLGNPVDKNQIDEYGEMKRIFEKSVVSVCFIPLGTKISAEMISVKKPGNGVPAAEFERVVGSVAVVDILPDTLITGSDIGWHF